MSKPSKKRRTPQPDPDHLPPMCSRCSRCGNPWLTAQMTPHKQDVLCWPCQEAFEMAVAQARYQMEEAERMLATELRRAKNAHLN